MRALWLCLCLGLAACADTGVKTWYRADGSPHAPGQLETDKVACEQEMKKPQATRTAGLDRDIVQADVYEKCMTRLGYTDMKPSVSAPFVAAPPAIAAPASAAPGAAPRGVAAPATAAVGAPPSASAGPPTGATPTGATPTGATPTATAPPAECRKLNDMRVWLPPCE